VAQGKANVTIFTSQGSCFPCGSSRMYTPLYIQNTYHVYCFLRFYNKGQLFLVNALLYRLKIFTLADPEVLTLYRLMYILFCGQTELRVGCEGPESSRSRFTYLKSFPCVCNNYLQKNIQCRTLLLQTY